MPLPVNRVTRCWQRAHNSLLAANPRFRDTDLLNLPSEDCNFQGSAIALKSANQANAVVIANNNMEGQSLAGIVVGNSIGGMIIE